MTVNVLKIYITESEFRARCNVLMDYLNRADLTGLVLFDRTYVLYYTGFAFIPTERPIAFVMNRDGERGMFVPRMEVEHASANALIDRVDHYTEYPDNPHPMNMLVSMMQDMGISGRIGADSDGYPRLFGYRGPRLSALGGFTIIDVGDIVEDQLAVKSPAEIALIAESCRWGNLALGLLHQYTAPGVTETEVTQRASQEASRAMLSTIGPIYKAQGWRAEGAFAEYRGQIGRNAAIPHALGNNIVFQTGDVVVGESGAAVWGYGSELERTMIVGRASDAQKRLFDHMLALQTLALEAIKPGIACSDVDRIVRAYYEDHDLSSNWRHHTGHAIGLRYHEGPFLDIGDSTIIQSGMVFTVEPGIYADDIGGFRHSDTVVVTEDGVDMLTYYPRDLQSLEIL